MSMERFCHLERSATPRKGIKHNIIFAAKQTNTTIRDLFGHYSGMFSIGNIALIGRRNIPDLFGERHPFMFSKLTTLLLHPTRLNRNTIFYKDRNKFCGILCVKITRIRITSKHKTFGRIHTIPNIQIEKKKMSALQNRLLNTALQIKNMSKISFEHRQKRYIDTQLTIWFEYSLTLVPYQQQCCNIIIEVFARSNVLATTIRMLFVLIAVFGIIFYIKIRGRSDDELHTLIGQFGHISRTAIIHRV